MKFAISATALATLALSLIPGADATWGYHRPAYKEKSGTCRTLLGRPGFYYKVGLSTLCVPDAWRCGADGVECNNKPSVDYCPAGTSWFEHRIGSANWKLCVPTSGDNEDDDDDPDCLEGAVWKDGRCQVETDPSCNPSTHFWWSAGSRCGQATSNRCIPRTTPSKEVTPPPEIPSACCPPNWHFASFAGKKICVPSSPKLPSCKGKPACPSTHGWDGSRGCCVKQGRKREVSASGELLPLGTPDADLCPSGLTSCPIAGAGPGAFECLDPQTELESCGGCTAMGQGEDCTAIARAGSVGCEEGVCKVYTCAQGLLHNNSCIV